MIDSWNTILDGVKLDVMAPQDSIGCTGTTLEYQQIMFKVWRQICDNKNIRFWSNVELFEARDCSQIDTSICADTRRIAHQMYNASQVAEKLISWEMLSYTDVARHGERAQALKTFLQKCGAAAK